MEVWYLSSGTITRLRGVIASDASTMLDKRFNPKQNRAGRRNVLRLEKERLIKDRMKFVAMMALLWIAADGRKGYENGVPSGDVARDFRARNRDITFQNAENKDQAKTRGESYHHVKTYADALRQVHTANPEIFVDGRRFWKMDETAVDAEFGQRIKVVGFSDTHHGGFRPQATSSTGDDCIARQVKGMGRFDIATFVLNFPVCTKNRPSSRNLKTLTLLS